MEILFYRKVKHAVESSFYVRSERNTRKLYCYKVASLIAGVNEFKGHFKNFKGNFKN